MLTRGGNRVPAGRDPIRWTEKGWFRNSDILGCLPRLGRACINRAVLNGH
jgi:hypothetical protein